MKLKLPGALDEAPTPDESATNVADDLTNQSETPSAAAAQTLDSKVEQSPATPLGPVLDEAVASQPVVRKKHVAQEPEPPAPSTSATDQLKSAGGFVAAVGAGLLGLMGVFIVARGGVMRGGSQPNTGPAGQPDLGRGAADGAGGRFL
jgi:hypothetical protein